MTGIEYKNIKTKTIGIYWFRNIDTNEYYVGQSLDIQKRFCTHLRHIKHKWNYPFYNAVNKYGFDKFEFHIELIIEREGRDNKTLTQILNNLEIETISKYDSYNNGYNLTIGGASISRYKLSEELKEKYSEINKKIQNDGRNVLYVYNIKTKEYSDWPTLKAFFKEYNLTSKHIISKKLTIVDGQWIAARSKEDLERKIKEVENHNITRFTGSFKCNVKDDQFIDDLRNLPIEDVINKYKICKKSYYNYLARLGINNKSKQGKDPRIKCSKENFLKDYPILSRDELCKKYDISIFQYYNLKRKLINKT